MRKQYLSYRDINRISRMETAYIYGLSLGACVEDVWMTKEDVMDFMEMEDNIEGLRRAIINREPWEGVEEPHDLLQMLEFFAVWRYRWLNLRGTNYEEMCERVAKAARKRLIQLYNAGTVKENIFEALKTE